MSTKTCNNCGMEIPISASICPYRRLSPCIIGGQPNSSGPTDGALTAIVWGAMMCPVLPWFGGTLVGLGILGKILERYE